MFVSFGLGMLGNGDRDYCEISLTASVRTKFHHPLPRDSASVLCLGGPGRNFKPTQECVGSSLMTDVIMVSVTNQAPSHHSLKQPLAIRHGQSHGRAKSSRC